MGIRKIDAIFLSHMDDDHINGIGELLKAIRNRETTLRIEKLFLSECNDKQEKRKVIEKTGREAGCRIYISMEGIGSKAESWNCAVFIPMKIQRETATKPPRSFFCLWGILGRFLPGIWRAQGKQQSQRLWSRNR